MNMIHNNTGEAPVFVTRRWYHVWAYFVVDTDLLFPNSASPSSAMDQEASVKAVLQALQVFSGQPDKASLESANRWLQDFQHTVRHLGSLCTRACLLRSRSTLARSMGDMQLFTDGTGLPDAFENLCRTDDSRESESERSVRATILNDAFPPSRSLSICIKSNHPSTLPSVTPS